MVQRRGLKETIYDRTSPYYDTFSVSSTPRPQKSITGQKHSQTLWQPEAKLSCLGETAGHIIAYLLKEWFYVTEAKSKKTMTSHGHVISESRPKATRSNGVTIENWCNERRKIGYIGNAPLRFKRAGTHSIACY